MLGTDGTVAVLCHVNLNIGVGTEVANCKHFLEFSNNYTSVLSSKLNGHRTLRKLHFKVGPLKYGSDAHYLIIVSIHI
jgi:hypothetical protein